MPSRNCGEFEGQVPMFALVDRIPCTTISSEATEREQEIVKRDVFQSEVLIHETNQLLS